MERKGLCFRCEHRAQFNESGSRPRYECGVTKSCMIGCYMYKPVRPVVLTKEDDDTRPQFGAPMFSARSRFKEVADMDLTVKKYGKGSVLYWAPKTNK